MCRAFLSYALVLCFVGCINRSAFTTADLSGSNIVIERPTLYPAQSSTLVTATVYSAGQPAVGGTVRFATDDAQATITQPAQTTDAKGQATGRFTTTDPGIWHISATILYGSVVSLQLPAMGTVTFDGSANGTTAGGGTVTTGSTTGGTSTTTAGGTTITGSTTTTTTGGTTTATTGGTTTSGGTTTATTGGTTTTGGSTTTTTGGTGGGVSNVAGVGGQSNGACVVLAGGNVKCWGYDPNGNLGYGDTMNRGTSATQMGSNLPLVNLGTGRTAVSTSVGGDTQNGDGLFACAVVDNANIECWGHNAEGELGLGTTTEQYAPTGSVNLPGGETAKAVVTGGQHACALLANQNIACWGYNGGGLLGMGDTQQRNAPTGTVNLGANRTATQIAAGSYHMCALLDDQNVTCWGANSDGQLGYGDNMQRNAPGPPFAPAGLKAQSIAAGGYTSCAILSDQNTVCWGFNTQGQVGHGNTAEQDLPVSVTFGGALRAQQISMGTQHACALTNDANIHCWGQNSYGELGMGDTTTRTAPPAAPVALPAGHSAIGVGAGNFVSCALLDDQSITCWGLNDAGQLGQGDAMNRGDKSTTLPGSYPVVSY